MHHEACDLSQVRGQAAARRALEVAAAGDHPILFLGPRGSGKTTLIRCLPGLLPPLTNQEAEEVAALHGLKELPSSRPLRRPDFRIRPAAMLGTRHRPGEVSLAHGGVLALDDLPCFSVEALRTLLQPLDFGAVQLNRGGSTVYRPARFLLAGSCRYCPCGAVGSPLDDPCACTPKQRRRYLRRVHVLADRIALWVGVVGLPLSELRTSRHQESSQVVRERILRARARRPTREVFPEPGKLAPACRRLLEKARKGLALSVRELRNVLSVARTLACLAGVRQIEPSHIAEALQYRTPPAVLKGYSARGREEMRSGRLSADRVAG